MEILFRAMWWLIGALLVAAVLVVAVQPLGPLALRIAVTAAAALACTVIGAIVLLDKGTRLLAGAAVAAAVFVLAAGGSAAPAGAVLAASVFVFSRRWMLATAPAIVAAATVDGSWLGILRDLSLWAAGIAVPMWIMFFLHPVLYGVERGIYSPERAWVRDLETGAFRPWRYSDGEHPRRR